MISENLSEFAGKQVKDWDGDFDPAKQVVRIRVSYDDEESWTDRLHSFLEHPKSREADALIVGLWADDSGVSSEAVVEGLVAAREKLPKLRRMFLGDIISEECEISWIQQSDLSPLFEAYPQLEHLTIRGAEGLSIGSPRAQALRELIIQCGGLRPDVIHEIGSADLPNLEHLELWLGEPNYGGDATVEDLAPLLKGDRFPKLRYLGLKDSEISDEIAGVVAIAPITQRIKVLDLSMGTLGDDGAAALLASPPVAKLEELNLRHHFISDGLAKKLMALGPKVNLDEKEDADEWGGESHRFIEVGE